MSGRSLSESSESVPTLTVTVRRDDAECMVLGPLEYAVKCMAGEAPKGASPMRLRQALAKALAQSSAESCQANLYVPSTPRGKG